MKKFKKILKIGIIPFALPVFAFAVETINTLLVSITTILRSVIPVILIIATIIFIWGLIMYIVSAGKEESRKEARNIMVWGIIILFVTVAVWGFVNILGTTLNVENAAIPTGPQ